MPRLQPRAARQTFIALGVGLRGAVQRRNMWAQQAWCLLPVCVGLRLATHGSGWIQALPPTYPALFFPELHVLIDAALRLMRIFRISSHRLRERVPELRAARCAPAGARSRCLFTAVAMVVLVLGTVMYVVRGPAKRL